MTVTRPSRDIAGTTLAVLFIGILIAASFWILYPFLTAIIWATMIVVTTWPLMLAVQQRLWGKRALAVTVMTVALLLVFIIPFTLAIVGIVDRADDIVGWVRSVATLTMPPPPAWVERVPLVGPKLAAGWQQFASISPVELSERLAPHAKKIAGWLVAQAGSGGMMVVQFLLTVLTSSVLYANGENAADRVCRFARRLAGQRGVDAASLAARAMRGVALGVVVTALIQALIGGIGLALAGVPAVTLLTGVMFVLCVAQIGPGLVLIPAVVWLFWQGQAIWGTLMIVWTLIDCTIDSFIRPALIKRGADLPLLLGFAGVIGGLVAFGVIGLFIGPVLLAVAFTLLDDWVCAGESGQEELCPRTAARSDEGQ